MTPTEWSRAQKLIVEIAQTLSRLTVQTIPSSSMSLHHHFFIPPSVVPGDSLLHKNSVRLLTTLNAALDKVQIDEWATETPPVEARKEPEGKARESEPVGEKKVESPAYPLPLSKQPEESQNPQKVLHPQKQPEEKTAENPKEAPLLITLVKELSHQVRRAIVELSTSTFIQDPQEAPLRDALKKLKPHLDRIIESIAEAQKKGEIPRLQFRHPVPTSPREELIKKLSPPKDSLERPLPKTKRGVEPRSLAPQERPLVLQERSKRKEPLLSKKEDAKEIEVSQMRREKIKRGGEEGEKSSTTVFMEGFLAKPREAERGGRPPNQIVLPGAPFTPEPRQQILTRKKKKRKGFWFKEEEERDNS